MILGFIIIIIGFICTYVYVHVSKSKSASKKTFIISVFMVLSTLALSIGAVILQNTIPFLSFQKDRIESDMLQKDSVEQNVEQPDNHNSDPQEGSSQQESESNPNITVDSTDSTMDLSGDTIPQDTFENTENSSKNELIAKEINGKWGYVNQAGEVIIPFQYDYADRFIEELAAVRVGYYWGFIDENGNTVIPFSYAGAMTFINGLAPVFKDGLWGFIDKNENVVIPFQYSNISRSGSTYYDQNDNPIKY